MPTRDNKQIVHNQILSNVSKTADIAFLSIFYTKR